MFYNPRSKQKYFILIAFISWLMFAGFFAGRARADLNFFTSLTTNNSIDDNNADAAIDSQNRIRLAYERDGSIIYYNGGGEELVASGTIPALALTASGSPRIVLIDNNGIELASRSDSGNWATTSISQGNYADIDIDASGYTHIVYINPDYDSDPENEVLYTDDTGGNFSAPVLIADGNPTDGTDYSNPNIKIDQNGNYHIALNYINGADSAVMALTSGGSVSSPAFDWDTDQGIGRNGLSLNASGQENIAYINSGIVSWGAINGTWTETQTGYPGKHASIGVNGSYVGMSFTKLPGGTVTYIENADSFSNDYGFSTGDDSVLIMKPSNEVHIYFTGSDGNDNEIVHAFNDLMPPTGTVTVSSSIVGENNLVQNVTVTYDETMDNAINPVISLSGLSGQATSNSDGQWDNTSQIWTESFTIEDADEEAADVEVTSSAAQDLAGNPEGSSTPGHFQLDTLAPDVHFSCVLIGTSTQSTIGGGSGLNGAFRIGDTVVAKWDNQNCDHIGDVSQVNFDMSSFRSVDGTVAAATSTDNPDVWTATLSGPIDDLDTENNSVVITVFDRAGNYTEKSKGVSYNIDTIAPAFDISPVSALLLDGSDPALPSNYWYYYPGQPLRMKVNYQAELDTQPLNTVKLCTRSLTENNPNAICSSHDFLDTDNYRELSIDDQNNLASSSNFWPAWPAQTGAYKMNIELTDNAGNQTISNDASQIFTAVVGINPKDQITLLNNADTTDWSVITDFSSIPADNLVFNAAQGGNNVARLVFKDYVSLADPNTISALMNIGNYLTLNAGSIRLDSSILAAMNQPAELSFWLPAANRPGIIVKNNGGTTLGIIAPLDQVGTVAAGGDNLSSFDWDANARRLTFNTSGFSQFDMDYSGPVFGAITATPIYINNGINYISPSYVLDVSAPVSDTGAGVDTGSCTYSLDGGNSWISTGYSGGDCRVSSLVLGSDTAINFQAADQVGNIGSGTPAMIRIDSTAPTVNAGTTQTKNSQFNYTGASASDSESGVSDYSWSQQSGPGILVFGSAAFKNTAISANIDGAYTARLSVTDHVGNTGFGDLTIVWDTTPPSVVKLGDGLTDYTIAKNNHAALSFSESLSNIGKTNVQNALSAGADDSLSFSWNGSSTALTITNSGNHKITFDNDVYASVADTLENSSEQMLIDSELDNGQIAASSSVTVSNSQKEVVVTNSQPVVINIPGNVNNTEINVDAISTSTGGVLPSITINATTSAAVMQIVIPDSTRISADPGWNGIINAPTVRDTNTVHFTPDYGKLLTVNSVIEIGFGDVKLSFDKSVRILLKGQANKLAGYKRNGIFNLINNACSADSQSVVDAQLIGNREDCSINVGDDLVIWTKHFTEFVAYQQSDNYSGGSGSTPSICSVVEYGPWEKCSASRQNRVLSRITPDGCTLSDVQLTALSRTCGKNDQDQFSNSQSNNPGASTSTSNFPSITGQVKGVKIYADGSLLRGPDKKVYYIKRRKKYHIKSLKELRKYINIPIRNVSRTEIDKY